MGQDQAKLRGFLFATVLCAAFFCSIAVALSWLGHADAPQQSGTLAASSR
jgi:hypothetical protein